MKTELFRWWQAIIVNLIVLGIVYIVVVMIANRDDWIFWFMLISGIATVRLMLHILYPNDSD
jgi:hypothetical protein